MRASCTIQNKNWFFETPDIPYFLTWSGLFSFVKDSRDIGVGRGWGEGGGGKGYVAPLSNYWGPIALPHLSNYWGAWSLLPPPLPMPMSRESVFRGQRVCCPPSQIIGGGGYCPPHLSQIIGGPGPSCPPLPPPPPPQ